MFESLKNYFPEKTHLAVSLTGGGLSFFDRLTRQGGTSRFFRYGEIPYGQEFQLEDTKSVSVEMAQYLATSMRFKMVEAGGYTNESLFIGVGASFSLMKDVGERLDRINHGYISICCGQIAKIYIDNYHVVFNKNFYEDRDSQENAAALLVAQLIYKHAVEPTMIPRVPGVYIE